ncbi:MAG: cytochrome C oxidase subunit IV family protein [Lentisphaeria bacterium]
MSAHSDEHPHVLPLKVYYGVGAILFILTAVTVLTGKYLHLDNMVEEVFKLEFIGLNLILAMVIATVKGALVALFFMHLLYDNKIYMLIFVGGLTFLSFFFILTLFDTVHRGRVYAERDTIWTESAIYDQLRANPEDVLSIHGHGDAHGDDAHGSDAHGSDAHGSDAHGSDAHGDDAHGDDAHGDDAHGDDAHGEAEGHEGHGH